MIKNHRCLCLLLTVLWGMWNLPLAGEPVIIRAPEGSGDFARRLQWALEHRHPSGTDSIWIGFAVARQMPENEYFWGTGRHLMIIRQHSLNVSDETPSLQTLVADPAQAAAAPSPAEQLQSEAQRVLEEQRRKAAGAPPRKVLRKIAYLLAYPATARHPAEVQDIRLQSIELPPRLENGPLYWLGEQTPAQTVPVLIQIYPSVASMELRENLLKVLGLQPAPQLVVPFFAGILTPDTPENLRDAAVTRLRWQNDTLALPVLINAAYMDPSPQVREEAVESIGELAVPGTLSALREFARNSPEADIRETAIDALGNLQDPDVPSILEEAAFHDPDEDVQATAVQALAEQRSPAALTFLQQVIRTHPNADIRAEAVRQLRGQPLENPAQLLEELAFNDQTEEVREEALEMLAALPDKGGVEPLIRIYRRHPDADIRAEAIELLAEVAAARAASLLQETITDAGDLSLQLTALRTLADIEDEEGIRRLVEIAKTATDRRIRKRAILLLGDSEHPAAHAALIEIVQKL